MRGKTFVHWYVYVLELRFDLGDNQKAICSRFLTARSHFTVLLITAQRQ